MSWSALLPAVKRNRQPVAGFGPVRSNTRNGFHLLAADTAQVLMRTLMHSYQIGIVQSKTVQVLQTEVSSMRLATALLVSVLTFPALADNFHAEEYAQMEKNMEEAEAKLNQVWNTYYPRLRKADPEKADKLLDEQRAWLAFRGMSCSIYAGSGGFWGEANTSACRTEIVEQRAKYLEDLKEVLEN